VPVISPTPEAEIRRIAVQDQPGQKILMRPYLNKYAGCDVDISYAEGIGRRMAVLGWLSKKQETLSEK
jgi:hypothetical protein